MPLNLDDSKFVTFLATMWYIWKARNERKYQGKKWTPIQVHHAVAAFISTQPQQEPHNSTPISDDDQATPSQQQLVGTSFLLSTGPTNNATPLQTNSFRTTQPALIEGIRCYTDASTSPDQATHSFRPAGLGIFFLIPQEQAARSIFIKATVADVHSVFMAEAAALALAATIAQTHHCRIWGSKNKNFSTA